jgi:2,3-bisphosphoglycerate-independent phosphoglycerate mutase
MKYIVILIDGAADYRIKELNDTTPLQYAKKPVMDFLAKHGIVGMVKTIPDGMSPGSDTANLSVLGYDPRKYYTGRSSLEAVSMGINLTDEDITFRCNLVTLSDEESYSEKKMIDYSSGEITTQESKILIEDIDKTLGMADIKFYPGVSYRHVIVWKLGSDEFKLTPPHDISGKKIGSYLPEGKYKNIIFDLMVRSTVILSNHPVNKKRIENNLRPANSIWIWGEGKKPRLDSFYEKYGLKGSVISAVDLVKGIGICAGLKSVNVEGATGNIHTNFTGKARAVIDELKSGQDFVYVHIEAPDECSHQGDIFNKVKAIEIIDEKVIKVIKDSMDDIKDDYKVLILPDHPTPISKMTHTAEPVPFLIYQSNTKVYNDLQTFDEFCAQNTGLFIDEGYKLLNYFLKNSGG